MKLLDSLPVGGSNASESFSMAEFKLEEMEEDKNKPIDVINMLVE